MEKKTQESLFYKIVRPIITFLVKVIIRPNIINKNNILKKGRVILAGNHTNNFDCVLLISSTKRAVHFLTKDELFKWPYKIIFANLGLIPVNRKTKDPNALKRAIEYLEDDRLIGIFPEGTFERVKGEFLPFKIGAVKMAYETKTPIIPFAITGDYKLFKKGTVIRYGEPFYVTNSDLDKANEELKNKIRELM